MQKLYFNVLFEKTILFFMWKNNFIFMWKTILVKNFIKCKSVVTIKLENVKFLVKFCKNEYNIKT